LADHYLASRVLTRCGHAMTIGWFALPRTYSAYNIVTYFLASPSQVHKGFIPLTCKRRRLTLRPLRRCRFRHYNLDISLCSPPPPRSPAPMRTRPQNPSHGARVRSAAPAALLLAAPPALPPRQRPRRFPFVGGLHEAHGFTAPSCACELEAMVVGRGLPGGGAWLALRWLITDEVARGRRG
jgi:hypothetical protein